MKVSLSWLKDYVNIEMEPSALGDALTMAGLEVEKISDRYDYLDKVVTARIHQITPHPKADRLNLCSVDVGDRILKIVCGADNVKKNMLVPLALPGAILGAGHKIAISEIRGEKSEGMLCSEVELGLGTDKKGIMSLDHNVSVGEKISSVLSLSDTIFEIDLTPNRADCLSIIGIAREIAAFSNTTLRYPDPSLSNEITGEPDNNLDRMASVCVENYDHCPRYTARIFENIMVESSPGWIQDRLVSVGIKPVNNIVDITNFVMFETGQPLHAFDLDMLNGYKIIVRTAKEDESFITLDNKERKLSSDMLMICDEDRPVAVAGIMGGLNSEISDTTTRVLLESAYFDPVSIRRTSKRLGLNTESSHRFERGVDPCGVITALNRATQLILKNNGCRLIKKVFDNNSKSFEQLSINLNAGYINNLLGINLKQTVIEKTLKSIEFKVEKKDGDNFMVTPPSFRVDIKRPVDIAEEVARLWGYDNIPVTYPVIPAIDLQASTQFDMRYRIKEIIKAFGYSEAINYSFFSAESCDLLGLKHDNEKRNFVNILNPLSKDQAVMRTSLLPGLLETVRHNISQQEKNLRLFEIGNTFIVKDSFIVKNSLELPEENEILICLLTGLSRPSAWNVKSIDCDFYDIKGVAECLFNVLGISRIEQLQPVFTNLPNQLCDYTKHGHTAQILVKNEMLGIVGEIAPDVLENYDIKQPVFILEIDLKKMYPIIPDSLPAVSLPKFPSIARDVTLIINKNIEVAAVFKKINEMDIEWIEAVNLFDVFEGKSVPSDKKSISFRITYRSNLETLEDSTINMLHKKIINMIVEKFDAALP